MGSEVQEVAYKGTDKQTNEECNSETEGNKK
jgi:hypothetical protein